MNKRNNNNNDNNNNDNNNNNNNSILHSSTCFTHFKFHFIFTMLHLYFLKTLRDQFEAFVYQVINKNFVRSHYGFFNLLVLPLFLNTLPHPPPPHSPSQLTLLTTPYAMYNEVILLLKNYIDQNIGLSCWLNHELPCLFCSVLFHFLQLKTT